MTEEGEVTEVEEEAILILELTVNHSLGKLREAREALDLSTAALELAVQAYLFVHKLQSRVIGDFPYWGSAANALRFHQDCRLEASVLIREGWNPSDPIEDYWAKGLFKQVTRPRKRKRLSQLGRTNPHVPRF